MTKEAEREPSDRAHHIEEAATPFTVETYHGSKAFWDEHGEAVREVCSTVFRPVIATYPDFTPTHVDTALDQQLQTFGKELQDPDAIIVLLREKQDTAKKIVGFTYATPLVRAKDTPGDGHIDTVQVAIKEKTALMGVTAILQDYRGQHGWRLMINQLYTALTISGRYEYLERQVRTRNGYHSKVEANPGGTIMDKYIAEDHFEGQLAFFRVRLHKH